jgi:type IV secretion system protein VirB2
MKTQTKELSIAWQVCLMVMLTVAVIILPDAVFAATSDTPMGEVLCKVKDWFTGNTGKGLATIAITIIGIGALLGKVSWGMAMIVGIGVAIVFGAAQIVTAMGTSNTGGASGTCAT